MTKTSFKSFLLGYLLFIYIIMPIICDNRVRIINSNSLDLNKTNESCGNSKCYKNFNKNNTTKIQLANFPVLRIYATTKVKIKSTEMYNKTKYIIKRDADNILSKNISNILTNLLKSYEKSQLPTHRQGIPTMVRISTLIRSMGPVSELDMDYSMDCYFRQYWRDSRLSFKGPIKSLSLSIKMLDKIWRPDTYFYNGKQSHIHTITVPNKLLRLSQEGDILYSMRLTIKATCPMYLKNFPMDRQSCPLIIGSYSYTNRQINYQWVDKDAVTFVPGMTLNQFDLISMPHKNGSYYRREGKFSVLNVSFNLNRHFGFFLLQVYIPCVLIVVLSWVSFWIHREATSDRVGLCITSVLTLSTISLDSRTDLPKVKYATALDWFLLMSFFYCIATLLEFAGVHYFTKIGSGELSMANDDEWIDMDEFDEFITTCHRCHNDHAAENSVHTCSNPGSSQIFHEQVSHASTMERTTQTEQMYLSKWSQLWKCFIGDDKFRQKRQREAAQAAQGKFQLNSVSKIDKISRVAFPLSFIIFNVSYWILYIFQQDFPRNTTP